MTDSETTVDDIQDSIVNHVDDSELAEVAVAVLACVYLGAVEYGLIASVPELRMLAIMVILTAVGGDTLYKRFKRKNGS